MLARGRLTFPVFPWSRIILVRNMAFVFVCFVNDCVCFWSGERILTWDAFPLKLLSEISKMPIIAQPT